MVMLSPHTTPRRHKHALHDLPYLAAHVLLACILSHHAVGQGACLVQAHTGDVCALPNDLCKHQRQPLLVQPSLRRQAHSRQHQRQPRRCSIDEHVQHSPDDALDVWVVLPGSDNVWNEDQALECQGEEVQAQDILQARLLEFARACLCTRHASIPMQHDTTAPPFWPS